MTDQELIEQYLANGGKITKIDSGWPLDLPPEWEGPLMPTNSHRRDILPKEIEGRRTEIIPRAAVIDETVVNYG